MKRFQGSQLTVALFLCIILASSYPMEPSQQFLRKKDFEMIPAPDFYLVKIIRKNERKNFYVCEINRKIDATFKKRVVLRLDYSSGFSGIKIGTPYYFEGRMRTPDFIGEFIEIKGVILPKKNTLEIISWKRNIFYRQAFWDYRSALFVRAQARELTRQAEERYNARFDGLPPNKGLAWPGGEVRIPDPPDAGLPFPDEPRTPEAVSQKIQEELTEIIQDKSQINDLNSRIEDLSVVDLSEIPDGWEFLERRESSESLIAKIKRRLENIELSLSSIRKHLEGVMQ